MKIKGFKNVNLVYSDGVKLGSIGIEDGVIAEAKANEGYIELPSTFYVAPGFIDQHIHGANGKDVMDGEIASLEVMATSLPQEGVTSFLATTMTESLPNIEKALKNVAEYRLIQKNGAKVVGIHLEGPFISKKFKGAQSEEFVQKPNGSLLSKWQKMSENAIKEITFAYEEEGGKEFLKTILELGITPSLGHSDCPGNLALQGFQNGIACVTHFYNAQRPLHHRDIGVVGAALLNKGVKTEIIADFHHSCSEAVELLFKTKAKEDIILISDSTEAKYLPEGSKAKLGSQEIYVEGGLAKLTNGTIAGSILQLDQGLRNVKSIAPNYSYADLINLVTLNPAKNLKLDNEIGSIEVGKKADLVILDENFHVYATIVEGEIVYLKEGFTL